LVPSNLLFGNQALKDQNLNNNAIIIKVLFFGATADETGKRSIDLSLAEDSDAEIALNEVLTQFPELKNHRLLFAVNQEYVAGALKLKDGDEVAVFTAVSGG
jgi:molybdopterin converting factor small subunit